MNGLVRKSAAPASNPRSRSALSDNVVSRITGMCAVRGLDFNRLHTSNPSNLRHHHVEQDEVGQLGFGYLHGCRPETGVNGVEALLVQLAFQHNDVQRQIVNDENERLLPRFALGARAGLRGHLLTLPFPGCGYGHSSVGPQRAPHCE